MPYEFLNYSLIETAEEWSGLTQINLRARQEITTPYTQGTIIYAETDKGEQFVVKISGIGGSIREWTGLNKTSKAGISVPKAYALVKDKSNRMGVVLKYVNGSTLYKTNDDASRNTFGALIYKMHQLTQINGTEWQSSKSSRFAYFQENLSKWEEIHPNKLEQWDKSQEVLTNLQVGTEIYYEEIQPVFNHNDLHDGQVIIDNKQPILIDFEGWSEDSPMNDLACYVFHSIRTGISSNKFEEFLNGYCKEKPFSEPEKQALIFQLLFISSRALIHFYQQGDSYIKIAKNTHNNILNYVENESIWKHF